jgi:DNA-binding NtrC family response regulator
MGYGLGREGLGRESSENKAAARTVVLASADADFRGRLRRQLTAMRWQVREAGGGAEAMAQLEMQSAEAMVLDSVLPDLEVGEFAEEMRSRHPVMDLLRVDAGADEIGARSPRRNELLHALRQAQLDTDAGSPAEMPAWAVARAGVPQSSAAERLAPGGVRGRAALEVATLVRSRPQMDDGRLRGLGVVEELAAANLEALPSRAMRPRTAPLPEMVGESQDMLEMAKMVRLVAPRSTTVLIEGDTGTGKELVAKAVYRLSARASKPFQVLNCAAIPEALLEAELFGHTRGAFTGAVQSRTGRIEAANGGTLFLDEIGEMPLALQAKMLRFLESGELQRVGDNETMRVDVRVVAATHQPLQRRAAEGAFRLDLYHRLAVFPVKVPSLRDRMEDVLPLAEYLLSRLGEEMPVKRLSAGAAERLMGHDWPGNVRELAHVLERGAILAEDRREIEREEIRL